MSRWKRFDLDSEVKIDLEHKMKLGSNFNLNLEHKKDLKFKLKSHILLQVPN